MTERQKELAEVTRKAYVDCDGTGEESWWAAAKAVLIKAGAYTRERIPTADPHHYLEPQAAAAIDAMAAIADRCGWGVDDGDFVGANGKVVARIEMHAEGVTIWLPKGLRMEVEG